VRPSSAHAHHDPMAHARDADTQPLLQPNMAGLLRVRCGAATRDPGLARSGEAPEAASYKSDRKSSRVVESRLRFFYGTFTRLLRCLYDSVQHPWYPPRSL